MCHIQERSLLLFQFLNYLPFVLNLCPGYNSSTLWNIHETSQIFLWVHHIETMCQEHERSLVISVSELPPLVQNPRLGHHIEKMCRKQERSFQFLNNLPLSKICVLTKTPYLFEYIRETSFMGASYRNDESRTRKITGYFCF